MGNNKSMMIIILVVLLVLIGIIVAGLFLIMSNINAAQVPQEPITILVPAAPSEADIRPFILDGNISTNLHTGSGGGNRFAVLTSPGIGINNLDPDAADEFIEMISEREIVVRDTITSILRRKTAEELNALGGDDILREEILVALQEAFQTQLIVRVYFTLAVQ